MPRRWGRHSPVVKARTQASDMNAVTQTQPQTEGYYSELRRNGLKFAKKSFVMTEMTCRISM
jgi:hypothetical protein